jgi:hypothetical protein
MNDSKANNKRTSGKSRGKVTRRSYTPISDALSQPQVFADTEMADGIGRHGMVAGLKQAMSRDRRSDGEPLSNILAALLAWPLLKVPSIHCFCCELCQFLQGSKESSSTKGLHNILYNFLGREDINWRRQSSNLSASVARSNDLGPVEERALVADDSLKKRRGKKVEGSSDHWDHTEGRVVKGHQVMELGMAGKKGYLPILRQLFMGEKNAVNKEESKDFRDKRSAAARDMKRARDEDKQTMFRGMLKTAGKLGFLARYVLADAWFGCKENIEAAIELGYVGIFQMKRGNLKYLVTTQDQDEDGGRYCTAKELYARNKRRMKEARKGARYKTCRIKAWVNLETNSKKPERLEEVILILSAPVRETGGDESWVIFLCTDTEMRAERVLEIYTLRWSIEVYFKEVKQYFGLLAEQSGRYQLAYASVHLAAMRYTLIFEAMLRSGGLSYGEVRDKQSGKLQVLSFAGLLWELFRALIEGALDALVATLGQELVDIVMTAIDEAVDSFLTQALQMEPSQIGSQLKAEAAGYL